MNPAIKLHGRVRIGGPSGCRVLRIAEAASSARPEQEAVWADSLARDRGSVTSWGAVLHRDVDAPTSTHASTMSVDVTPELAYLQTGDVIRLNAEAQSLNVLYRRASRFNSLLVTERCNSNCIMCSQPPKDRDDGYLVDELVTAIPLFDPATPELGITGGEPLLLADRFFELVESIKSHLPATSLHVLTNGRLFCRGESARRLAAIGHPDLMLGIPLYSDLPWEHDFVVQAGGAFDQTVEGLLQLARYGVAVELRVVLHRQTIPRLPQLGRFIARNLPFVQHVALMGLELMGYTPMNLDALWIDPLDYQKELRACVCELERGSVEARIFNHQFCVLDRELWPRAVRSISDWKNTYLSECDGCAVRGECGGFFASAERRTSRGIAAISQAAS